MTLLASTFAEANGLSGSRGASMEANGAYENAVLEVTEAGASMESAYQVQEQLENIHTGLESIVDAVAAHKEEGLSPEAAGFMQIAVESYTKPLGITHAPVASLESFGAASDRADATNVSMEGIGDTLKKVWKAIKEAAMRAMKKVADFFAAMFGGIDKVITKLEDEEKKVKEAIEKKHTAKDDAKVKIKSLSALHINGKADASSVKKGLETLESCWGDAVGGVAGDIADFYAEAIEKAANKLRDAEDDTKAKEVGEEFAENAANVLKTYEKTTGLQFSGGKALIFEESTKEGKDGQEGSFKPAYVGAFSKNFKFDENKEMDVWSLKDTLSVLETAKGLANKLKEKKKPLEDIKKAREQAVKDAEKAIKDVDAGKFKTKVAAAKLRWVIGFTNKGFDRPINDLAKHGFSTLRAVIAASSAVRTKYKAPKDSK